MDVVVVAGAVFAVPALLFVVVAVVAVTTAAVAVAAVPPVVRRISFNKGTCLPFFPLLKQAGPRWGYTPPTAIPCRMHRISSDLRS